MSPTLDADVLVIGAGLTGAMIAARLADDGARVAVVDALTVAAGATRLQPGLVSAHAATRDETLHIQTQRGAHLLVEQARAHGLDVIDVRATLLDSGSPDTPRYTVIGQQQAWLVDLAALTRELLRRAQIQVRDGLEVKAIEPDADHVDVLAEGHSLRVRRVVLATGAYLGLFTSRLPDGYAVVRCAAWQSQPQPGSVTALGVPGALPFIVDGGRMLVCQDATGAVRISNMQQPDAAPRDPVEDTHRFIRRHLHALYDLSAHWQHGVAVASTLGRPQVSALRNFPHVLIALNAEPFAPAWAPWLAEQVAGQIG